MVANGRDAGGRFTEGNGGGPGRPKKRKQLDDSSLVDLMNAGESGAELYLAAMALQNRDEFVAMIERDFPKHILDRIRTIIGLSDLARGEIIKRLREAT